ncbi:NlpC/P60 family protein [Zavarzinia compransoris]|uniref:Peptidase P60 n=1 Tax=Zavarzinia compransoris TaxID=1264899 RepID=A0A317E1Y8_9PROT|nr:NlpC/P60 family protein [Zavarzinia compransoris]PWR19155.1 peptidase P60 [Zavarzinia compransoris]TDP49169.1 NlpC/P60 family putative phage cell wall peptidase [Zavarzinia compransoris]
MTAPAWPERIVASARLWLGTPYLHQASVPGVGCDCLGLVRGIYRDLYGHEPELPPAYGPDWAEASGRETLALAARRHLTEIAPGEAGPGDVLLFSYGRGWPAKHCAVQTGPARMIHAYNLHPVAEVALVPWWRARLRFAFRFPTDL